MRTMMTGGLVRESIAKRHAGIASKHPFKRREQKLRESRVGQAQTVQLLISQPGQGVVLLRGTVGRLSSPLIDRPDVHPKVNALYLRERVTDHLSRDAQLFAQLSGQRQARDLTDLHMAAGQIPRIGVPPTLWRSMDQQRPTPPAQQPSNHDVLFGHRLLHSISVSVKAFQHRSWVVDHHRTPTVSCFRRPTPSPSKDPFAVAVKRAARVN
jgi:hypothetical protein